MVLSIEDRVPDPDREKDASRRGAMERALQYMALEPNKPLADVHVDKVFNRLLHQLAHRGPAGGRGHRAARRRAHRPRTSSSRWWCPVPGW
jgi:hypothetical protein